MPCLVGKPVDQESIRNYQANDLGRFRGNSLLCELMPIPTTLEGIGRDTAKAQKACEERVGEDYQGRGRERDIGSDSRRV